MHVGGNVYVICHVTFFPLILNFNIPISKFAALTYEIKFSIQACRVQNSWKKLIKKMLPYVIAFA